MQQKEIKRTVHLAEYCYAYSWIRFFELLIDYIVFFVLDVILLVAFPNLFTNAIGETSFLGNVLSVVAWLVYYFVCEALFDGRTIGKLITGLKVVDIDGNKASVKSVAIRTLCRLIPFDYLSFFGTDKWSSENNLDGFWHDSISRTYVIRAKKVQEFKALEQEGKNYISKYLDVPEETNKVSSSSSSEFKPGDKVLYPPVNRIMFVDSILDNGKIRCINLDSHGKKEPEGDYLPSQIQHID